ncbi:MAG: peptidase inhibitor I78 [Sphingomonas bacterium]|nr:peptidase inhibitor I78 [Sphingomonas bacterium]
MRIASLLPLLLLSACATTGVDSGVAEPAETCRRDALAPFVGQPAMQDLGARMLAASGARTLRWVAKGMMVTMEYRGDRLTVHLDANNRVERANCG